MRISNVSPLVIQKGRSTLHIILPLGWPLHTGAETARPERERDTFQFNFVP